MSEEQLARALRGRLDEELAPVRTDAGAEHRLRRRIEEHRSRSRGWRVPLAVATAVAAVVVACTLPFVLRSEEPVQPAAPGPAAPSVSSVPAVPSPEPTRSGSPVPSATGRPTAVPGASSGPAGSVPGRAVPSERAFAPRSP